MTIKIQDVTAYGMLPSKLEIQRFGSVVIHVVLSFLRMQESMLIAMWFPYQVRNDNRLREAGSLPA